MLFSKILTTREFIKNLFFYDICTLVKWLTKQDKTKQ